VASAGRPRPSLARIYQRTVAPARAPAFCQPPLRPHIARLLARFHPFTCGSGAPPVGAWFVAGRHARLVLLGEDLTHELSAASHTDLVEDGLEVIAHGARRDVQLPKDFGRRAFPL
jgi:hypothetical protein